MDARVNWLKKVFADPRGENVQKALESLDQNAGWAVAPLLEIYHRGNPRNKYYSALALIKLSEPRVIELLLRDVHAVDRWGHRDGPRNVTAALALGSAEKSPQIIEALRQAMREKEAVYCFFESLGFFIPNLGLPQSGACQLQEVAALSLVEQDVKELGGYIVRRAIIDWHYSIPKERFIKYMYEKGWENTIAQVASLLTKSPAVVVSCLREIGAEQCIEPLTEALKYKEPNIRKKALEALANIGSERAVQSITQAVDDSNGGVRRTARKMLKKLSRGK